MHFVLNLIELKQINSMILILVLYKGYIITFMKLLAQALKPQVHAEHRTSLKVCSFFPPKVEDSFSHYAMCHWLPFFIL